MDTGATGAIVMPTKKQKQELKRVTKLGGFRVGYHEFLAEVDFDALKKRNDTWESKHRNQRLQDRKIEEFGRIATYIALKSSVSHIQIHVHAAHEAGARPRSCTSLSTKSASTQITMPRKMLWKRGAAYSDPTCLPSSVWSS